MGCALNIDVSRFGWEVIRLTMRQFLCHQCDGGKKKKWATENAIRKIKNKDKSKKSLHNFFLLLLKNTSQKERMQKVEKPERSTILKMGSAIVG